MLITLRFKKTTQYSVVYQATRFDSPIKSVYILSQALEDMHGSIPEEITIDIVSMTGKT